MANTTFFNLKIKCLRLGGNWYNSADSTLLTIAGGIINDCLSTIQAMSPASKFWLDLENSKACTASQAYIDLTDTDILEIIAVYQRTTDTKLKRVDRNTWVNLVPDTTAYSGTPDLLYDAEQLLNTGVNTWRIYLFPTPATTTTMYYDYRKNARFTADGTGADAEYSPLPSQYDALIVEMFRTRFLNVIDIGNTSAISRAERSEQSALSKFIPMLNSKLDETYQLGSYRYRYPNQLTRVAATPTP